MAGKTNKRLTPLQVAINQGRMAIDHLLAITDGLENRHALLNALESKVNELRRDAIAGIAEKACGYLLNDTAKLSDENRACALGELCKHIQTLAIDFRERLAAEHGESTEP